MYDNQHKRYCDDCKQTVWLDHEYGEWENTIPATILFNGLQTKRCECGHEVTQTVNSLESDLVADTYTTNLLNSFEDKLCLTITDVDMQYYSEYENLEFTLNDAPLYIEMDEKGNISAYCEGVLNINFDGVTATFTAEAAYKDDFAYVSAIETGFEIDADYKFTHDYITGLVASDLTYKIPAGNIYTEEVPMDEYMAEIETMLNTFKDEINYISKNVNPEALNICINLAVKEIFNTAFVDGEEDGYCYSLNYEGLKELNAKLDTKTISELYDEYTKEGAYAELSTAVSSLFDLTFEDLNKYIEDNNIDVKSYIEYIDKLIKLEDEEASLKDYFEEMTNDEIKDLITYFSQTAMKDIKIVDFISENIGDITGYEENLLNILDAYKDITIYEFIAMLMEGAEGVEESSSEEPAEEYSELKQMVDSFIDLFDSIENCSFYTDSEGIITGVKLGFDFSAFEDMVGISGTVLGTIDFDYTATYDIDETINKVNATVSKIEINDETTIVKKEYYDQSIFVYYDDEFTFDQNGNLTGYNRVTERIHGEHISTNTTVTHDVYVTREEYSIDLTNAPLYISSACDRYEVEFLNNGKYVSTVRLYEGVTVDLETYNLHVEANDLDSYFYGLISNLNFTQVESYSHETNSIRLYYDSETNTADFNSYGTDEIHNFVKDEEKSVVGDSCCALNVDYYICSDCGAHSVDYWGHEHTGTVTKVYNDVDDCYSGDVEATCTCSECNMTWIEHPHGHDNTMQPIELFEGLTCTKGHSITGEVCACGEEFYPESNNIDTTMTIVEEIGTYCKYYCSDCGIYIIRNFDNNIYIYDIYLADPSTSEVYRSFTVYTY